MYSLRTEFKEALKRMFLLLSPEQDMESEESTPWKLLIFDSQTMGILSTIFSVSELRELGITVHMSIFSQRERIADVPAIYFVSPLEENLKRIAQDVSFKTYDSFYLNFTTSIPRSMLENLAKNLADSNTFSMVSSVVDRYLCFEVQEENMFSLGLDDVLPVFYSRNVLESEILQVADKIAEGLFGVCVTLKQIPVVRYQKGGAAELVAKKLVERLNDYLLSAKIQKQSRPTLLILDRHVDYTQMLQHTWLYGPLVHDVLNVKHNRVSFEFEDQKKTFDIDSNDFFWQKNSECPFPDVAAQVDLDLKSYKQETQDLLSATGASSIEEMNQMDKSLNAKQLKSAITKLPELTAKKRIIDTHMQIATKLVQEIKRRELDYLHELEQTKITKEQLTEIMTRKIEWSDKLRVLLLYSLQENVGLDDFPPVPQDVIPLIKHMIEVRPQSKLNFQKITETWAQGIGQAYGTIVDGVRQLRGKTNQLLQKVVNQMDNLLDDDILELDILQKGQSTSFIVFLIGSGNFVEYQQLMNLSKQRKKQIFYGSTKIENQNDFLNQMSKINWSP